MTPEYDEALKRLEEVVKALETEEPDLQRALALYTEGQELVGRCRRILNGVTVMNFQLQCPYKNCSNPDSIQQTSYGGNYEDFVCANNHDFAISRFRDERDEFEEPDELAS